MLQPAINALPQLNLGLPPKVYSYARWSTPEQAKGDSCRRQEAAAVKWAEQRGLSLDRSLAITDQGVSAFRGTNSEDGGLGRFLFACAQGLIQPGSYLLVESLDRISRMEPLEALMLFRQIVRSGVTIVTLSDGQEYTQQRLATDHSSLIIALMVAMRAHEESRTKGRRVGAAWAEKRRKVRADPTVRLTKRAPCWLVATDDGWREDIMKADIVRRVYAMTLAGAGEHLIAKTFNLEEVPMLGRGKLWHRSTICKLLRSPAVIGKLTPGRIEYVNGLRTRQLEEPIAGAFPAVVAEADWLAVRALKDGKASATRGRHAAQGVAHVLAGLARCPVCGSTMLRVMKGPKRGGKPKLVCSRAKNKAGCAYVSVPIDPVQTAFFTHWGDLFADIPASDGNTELDRAHANLEAAIWGTQDHLEHLIAAMDRAPSTAIAASVAREEAQLRTMRAQLEELDERRGLADHGIIRSRLDELGVLLEAAQEAGGELDLGRINATLKVLFSGVTVDHPQGVLRFHWRQGGETRIRYAWVD